jgi:hypothetical protein
MCDDGNFVPQDTRGTALVVKRRMAKLRAHEALIALKGKHLNIPDETQFRNGTRHSEEIHRLNCEVRVMATVACCLALPLAALVLAAFRNLTAFLLIRASNMEFTLDVCLGNDQNQWRGKLGDIKSTHI